MKTNTELVKHCEKALKEGWFYLWGAFGQKATQSLIVANIRQYPDNAKWRSYLSAAVGKNRVCDCYGLIKSFLWWMGDNNNPKYNAAQDRNTTGAWNAAKEKGLLATLPEIPGVILYMRGHVGVYCGGGRFIEIAGGGKGMIDGRITNGAVAKGSRFTHWFKDTFISYTADSQPPENEPLSGFTNMRVRFNSGAVQTIPAILREDMNYPNLRELCRLLGVNVNWNEREKIVELSR